VPQARQKPLHPFIAAALFSSFRTKKKKKKKKKEGNRRFSVSLTRPSN
jgi:hypothetical protein